MNTRVFTLQSAYHKLTYLALFLCLISCGPKEENNAESVTTPEPAAEVIPEMQEPTILSSVESSAFEPSTEKEDYKVVLSVDSVMYLGQSGMMQVWIGHDDIDVTFSKGMSQDEKKISNTAGRYAKVTPYAPDFDVEAASATICYKIDPGGTELRYSLTPKDEGEYKVSANIELYETEDCTGISVPKTARALSVSVGVNMDKKLSKELHKMEDVVLDKFMIFWVALITLLFGAAIYVIRRYIKQKTGYEDPTSNV